MPTSTIAPTARFAVAWVGDQRISGNGHPLFLSGTYKPRPYLGTAEPEQARKFSTAADAQGWIDGHLDWTTGVVWDLRAGSIAGTAADAGRQQP